ncbi:efflux transporter outer membrane subunit [Candidatus Magnetominusculus xianensis]|uniref:RND transporter n=1 Tax=Candidatus Magnetominusculus xianensis TaxID=1748249 RepID=A0ABR5SAL0_9BACT|nr:efflux transporter outer membrane subunit [Candidatus Magnetominusculus xianensis]KWT73752.1 RND transporter [Candidatus Magnetominusculus xianensis]MBF0405548.1 efflux transporter outer membrane subunit [Nitrospirota bacterium]
MRIILIILTACTLLNSCKAGMDYVRPEMSIPADYKEANIWKAAHPMDNVTKEAWWEAYNDSLLNELVREVSISNQSLAVKEAQFRQARALVDSSAAQLYPVVTLGATVNRNRGSGNSSGGGSSSASSSQSTLTNYSVPAALSWELDLWGKVRRTIEANQAGAEASFAELEALRLSTQAQLAEDYFQLRSLDTQRQILEETISGYEKTLQIIKNRYESGTVGRADVLNAETQLKTTAAQSIDLGVARATLEHAIAVLIGKPAPSFTIPFMPLSFGTPDIPYSVPSELLERRADIAAAQRRVAAANAQIGVAVAAYYPSVTLSPSSGFQSGVISKLFSWPSLVWSLGASLTQTIFDGGYKLAVTEQARANYDAAVATYRQTVLTAFAEVEDALSTHKILMTELRVQDEAVKSAEAAAAVAMNQYKAGIIGALDLIVVQNIALNNKKTAAVIKGRIMSNSVMLIKALGGQWSGLGNIGLETQYR